MADPIPYVPAIRSSSGPGELKQTMMFIDPTAEQDMLIGKVLNESPQVLDQCLSP